MTADVQKLKALALATEDRIGEWHNVHQIADGITFEEDAAFIAGCSPATVLELCNENTDLRAEVERLKLKTGQDFHRWERTANTYRYRAEKAEAEVEKLRTEVDCRGRAQGGGTSENAGATLPSKSAETRMDSGFHAGAGCSAPAAGTDQNAERYRLLIAGDIIDVDDEFLSSDCTEWEVVPPSARTVFLGCRYNPNMFKPARRKVAAIEARTKAGKETGP